MTDKLLIQKWTKGIPYEVAFWNNVYRWKHTFDGMMRWSRYGKCIELEQFDANNFLASCKEPNVMDVGSGLSFIPGSLYKDNNGAVRSLNIHYIDPLAHFYNKISKRYKRDVPLVEYALAEFLSSFYPQDSADLILIQNALDHSSVPIKGIFESLIVLKIGGILYLNHHPNEAEHENYKGFHKWNICIKEGKLHIWNKNEDIDLSKILEGFATIEVKEDGNGHVIAIIQKTADVPVELSNKANDCATLAEIMMEQNALLMDSSYSMSLKIKYYIYDIIQFFAQSLPWKLKMFIKNSLKV